MDIYHQAASHYVVLAVLLSTWYVDHAGLQLIYLTASVFGMLRLKACTTILSFGQYYLSWMGELVFLKIKGSSTLQFWDYIIRKGLWLGGWIFFLLKSYLSLLSMWLDCISSYIFALAAFISWSSHHWMCASYRYSLQNLPILGWRDGAEVKGTCCSCRRPGFWLQHPYGGS